jgi:hypothetical protein
MRSRLFVIFALAGCSFPGYLLEPLATGGGSGAGGDGLGQGAGMGGVETSGARESAAEAGDAGQTAGNGAAASGVELEVHVNGSGTTLDWLPSGNTGGTPYLDICPAGLVLIGFKATADSDATPINSIAGVCGSVDIGPAPSFAVTTVVRTDLPFRHANAARVYTSLCPDNHVVVGFSGEDSDRIEALTFRCAPLVVRAMPPYSLSFGEVIETAPLGIALAASAPFGPQDCPDRQLGIGQAPKAGVFLDAFTLQCAPLVLVEVPPN